VSDEEQKDAFAQREEGDDDAADVEAHAHGTKDAHYDKDATEEPPDVEGHALNPKDAFEAPAAHGPLDMND
jgi:hypothetical protein